MDAPNPIPAGPSASDGSSRPIIVNVPPPPPPPRRSVIGAVLKFVLWFVILPIWLLSLGLAGSRFQSEQSLTEDFHSLSETATDKIAIISIEGTLLSDEGFIKRQIDHVRDDEHVKGIIVRVDSPGGTITASDGIYHRLRKLREEKRVPMVVSMGAIAASGGYYVSMAVGDQPQAIYAEPTTWTGSIGVIIPHYDLSGLMETLKIEENSIVSHRLKGMGGFTRAMTEEERGILQGLVNDSFARFKEVIKYGRPNYATEEGEALLAKIATGQVFTAPQAKEHGLVDEIGYLESSIERVVELAGLSKDNVKVVRFREPLSVWNLAMGSAQDPPRMEIDALLDLATPRAYYLCSWLPTLATATGR